MAELKPCVLLSIQPKWCEFIASGKKTIEVRKTKPKIEEPFKCYIYETKGETDTPFIDEDGHIDFHGRGQVIGEFICDEIIYAGLGNYRILATSATQIDPLDLLDYADDKRVYGWVISDLVIYSRPKNLSEFRKICKYRNDDGSCQYRKVKCACVKFDFNPDCSVAFAECCDYMRKPPQSWCYVEEWEG